MKKWVLIFGLLLLGNLGAFAASKVSYTCVAPYDMNGSFRTTMSNISGANFIRTHASEKVLKNTLLKSTNAKKASVDIESFSAKDLKEGRFKSLSLYANDANISGVQLSEFEMKTLCDFNYVEYDTKGNLKFKEDLPMSYNFSMSENDLTNSMKSEKYQKIIDDVNRLSIIGMKITSTNVSIRGNTFYYIANIAIPFVKDQKLEISADLKVKDGKIDFENTRLASNSFKVDLRKIDFIINYLNPLNFTLDIFNNKKAKMSVKNVGIKNNMIVADGLFIVPKD